MRDSPPHAHRVLLVVLSSLVSLDQASAAAGQADPAELYKRLAPSVVIVEAVNSLGEVVAQGSGVTVAEGGIVTNGHVIKAAARLRVRQGERSWVATIGHFDPGHDLVQLAVPGFEGTPVEIRKSTSLQTGERVYALGSPKGLELTLSEGLISALRPFDDANVIQTSAAISPGSSGGGLFDAEGRLIGITTFQFEEGQNLNFALPGEWVKALPKHSAELVTATAIAGADDLEVAGLETYWVIVGADERVVELIPSARFRLRSKGNKPVPVLNAKAVFRRVGEEEVWATAYSPLIKVKPGADTPIQLQPYSARCRLRGAVDAAADSMKRPAFKDARVDVFLRAGWSGEWAKIIASKIDRRVPRPDDAASWGDLGDAYSRQGDHARASDAYRKAIELHAQSVQAWIGLGKAYRKLGRLAEGQAAYEKAMALAPRDHWTWGFLGEAYAEEGRYPEAVKAYQEALRLEIPELSNLTWCSLGDVYDRQGEYRLAANAYREAIKRSPDYASAWHWLGNALRRLEDYDQAVSAYREAIRLDPEAAEHWEALGTAYNLWGRHDLGAQSFREAIRLEPRRANAWAGLGQSYAQIGQPDRAIESYHEALRLQPDDPWAWYLLGIEYREKGSRAGMLEVYKRLRKLDPKQADKFFREILAP